LFLSVVGEDFFGREVELRKAESLIRDNNLMLAAPRRVGKTSFATRLIDTLSSKGWNTIFIDLEEITSIDHFFNAFYSELVTLPETKVSEKVKVKMKKWLSGVPQHLLVSGKEGTGKTFIVESIASELHS